MNNKLLSPNRTTSALKKQTNKQTNKNRNKNCGVKFHDGAVQWLTPHSTQITSKFLKVKKIFSKVIWSSTFKCIKPIIHKFAVSCLKTAIFTRLRVRDVHNSPWSFLQ